MDFYGDCGKLSFGDEPGLEDFLEQDVFSQTSPSAECHPSSVMESTGLETYSMDPDWLDSFLEDPVLNDRMMSDALQPQQPISNEHSYSNLHAANENADALDTLKNETVDQELPRELMTTTPKPLNLTIHRQNQLQQQQQQLQQQQQQQQQHMTMTAGSSFTSPCNTSTLIKSEPMDTIDTICTDSSDQIQTVTVTTTRAGQTILRQPTIILATTPGSTPGTVTTATIKQAERLVLPKTMNIKVEPERAESPDDVDISVYETLSLPPTPPSSASSDSEGGMSPQRSAPNSPIRHMQHSSTRHNPLRTQHLSSHSIFSSPIPTSGVLILSEEEKRTLISEGYPIPTKLPLTKQEEKNLKKVRRKIKNKISAQESRRKKKEYLETLEKKVEAYNQENVDLKRKMETLETNNRSLLVQLQKLQSLVGKVKPGTQTNTCLMVLVLCFAVFMGSWSSGFSSLGYSQYGGVVAPQTVSAPTGRVSTGVPVGPKVEDATVDAYSTPNMRSRVLLSMMEEDDLEYGPPTPFSYRDLFLRFFCSSEDNMEDKHKETGPVTMEPQMPENKVSEPEPEPELVLEHQKVEREVNLAANNDTAEKHDTYQAPMHPNIMADVRANVVPVEKRHMSATTA